ncbi:MAG: hypothetical protein IJT70_00040 [Clostridia bacterium]|nr:hypothetical protein [Clostridia bacterium]
MKFRRFCIKHTTAATLIPALAVWAILTAVTLGLGIDPSYNGLVAIIVLLLSSFGLKKYLQSYMKRAERSLYDDCDPYPTLNEINLYYECLKQNRRTAGLVVTRGMTQSLVGDYEGAEKTFTSLRVDDSSHLPDITKAGICYDLAALYSAMNLPRHAIEYYDRAKEHFLSSPDHLRDKMTFSGTTDALVECYKGNGERAIEILDGIEPSNRFQKVTKKFAFAKVHYILGERERAIGEFRWVAENGGKLACAGESAVIADAADNK